MSAYAHQVEQQYSARNLSDDSEMGSQYVLETGFYITSFAATILVTALVIVGVLLMTLLISLSIMLQSCQSRNTGLVELQNINDYYSYCNLHSLHAELNSLEGYNLPSICIDLAIHYFKEGQYARDLDITMSLIEKYFNSVGPTGDGLDVVLMDVDGIFSTTPHSSSLFHWFHNDSISNCIKETKKLKLMLVLRLYMNIQAGGWSIILLSKEPETHRNVTIIHLVSAGFRDWSSLMMRAEDEDSTKGNEYFSRQRNLIRRNGFRIKSFISNHMGALTAPDAQMRNFLLPESLCDKFEKLMKSIDARF